MPIIISTPDRHPLQHKGDEEEHSVPASYSPPKSYQVGSKTTSLISKVDTEVGTAMSKSPTHFQTKSPSSESPFGDLTDHFEHHNRSGPPTTTISAGSLLKSLAFDLPCRPMTPRTELYHGQEEKNFGMTFATRPAPQWSCCSKPTSCANTYEDQKHRMTMIWLERRGAV